MRARPSLSCFIMALVLSPVTAQPSGATVPDWVYQGDPGLGYLVASAGDVNADGFDDVIVVSPAGSFSEGKAHLFMGSPTGLPQAPSWTGIGGHWLGLVAYETAGDVNGDGFDDVLLCDGRLYFGSASGLTDAVQMTHVATGYGYDSFVTGDVNADGYGDVVAQSTNWADLFLGSAAGLPLDPSRRFTLQGAHYPPALDDLTGDGYADLVIGTWLWDPPIAGTIGINTLNVFRGDGSGEMRKSRALKQRYFEHIPILASPGDLNGDGFNDLLLGLSRRLRTGEDENTFEPAYFFSGSHSGPREVGPFYQTGLSLLGDVNGAGDVNGDGYDDVVLVDEELGAGRVLLFAGGPGGPTGPTTVLLETPGTINQFNRTRATAAGDVNGDGFDDVIIGSGYISRAELFLGRAGWPGSSVLPLSRPSTPGPAAQERAVDPHR